MYSNVLIGFTERDHHKVVPLVSTAGIHHLLNRKDSGILLKVNYQELVVVSCKDSLYTIFSFFMGSSSVRVSGKGTEIEFNVRVH